MVGFRKGLLITFYLVCYCKGLRDNGFPNLHGSQNEFESQSNFNGDILGSHVFQESIPLLSSRRDLTRKGRVHQEQTHEIIFVMKQKNTDKLIRFLDDVSDPRSVNFGRHMTREEINTLTAIPGARAALLKYLQCNGATVTSETSSGDYIKAVAAISTWEKVLNTEFYTFHRTLEDGRIDMVVRAEKYWIPKELNAHVSSVLNAIDLPARQSEDLRIKKPIPEDKVESRFSASSAPHGLTPAYIRKYYNLSDVYGSNLSTQAVFSYNERYFSPLSLANFQKYFNEPIQPVASVIGGYSSDNALNDSSDAVASIEYMTTISRGSPTTFWHSTGFADWLMEVSALERPPLVLVITFFQDEATTSKAEHNAFTLAAQKLGAMGVTILTAAGNDGAVNQRDSNFACSYRPQYPATNPYVTTVGATAGPEKGLSEIACQWDLGNTITSGGGFSEFYFRPKWQDTAVNGYFEQAEQDGHTPKLGYNRTGRGYPDISLAGDGYRVMIASSSNEVIGMSGTSAPCSVAAAFFSNINAARMAAGKGSVGFMNPALYAYSSSFINDITSGNNKCKCDEGFHTATGWDPVTGLGSIDYAKFQDTVLSLGTSTPTANPTRNPTLRPARRTQAPARTNPPTFEPTEEPSEQPTTWPTLFTFTPTLPPSSFPTVKSGASRVPTRRPSTSKPTIKSTQSPSFTTTNSPSKATLILPSPTAYPTASSSSKTSTKPTFCTCPTLIPTVSPSSSPTPSPSAAPTALPTLIPSSVVPTPSPTGIPTTPPVTTRTFRPSRFPTYKPTSLPNARTAPPSSAVYSSIRVYQTLSGISIDQASTSAFVSAVRNAISNVLSVDARSDVRIVMTPKTRGFSTQAASTVSLMYNVNVTSGLKPTELITRFQKSMNDGDFLEALQYNSNMTITNITSAAIVDVTPVRINTIRLNLGSVSHLARSSLSIAAVVGGVVGGILFILFGLYRLVYGAPKKQFELPRKKRKRPVVTREARYRPDNLVGIDGSRFHTEKL